MIICHNRKFIFIHIPKAAGSSIKNYLKGFLKFDDVNCQLAGADINIRSSKAGGAPAYLEYMRAEHGVHKHSTANELRAGLGDEYFDSFFSFAFVRNPYARAYSAYRFTLKWDEKLRPESKRYLEIKDMSFEQWLQSSYVIEYKMMQTKLQSHWLPNKKLVSYIGRTETFDNCMFEILMKVSNDAKRSAKLIELLGSVRNNQSTPIDEWKNMSGEASDLVFKHYQKDFENFDYSRSIQ